jgi:5'-methylthioadenosine nucleosidase
MSAMAAAGDAVVQHVLVVMAMEAEAEPLLKRLNLASVPCTVLHAPCLLYSGTYNGSTVSVVTNGKCGRFKVDNVGTVPASIATFVAINQFKPDLVINAGTAGGFRRKGATIGAAYLCSKVCNHDRRIPIPGFTEYGHGHHDAQTSPKTAAALGLATGIVSTGNSLDCTDTDDKLMGEHGTSVRCEKPRRITTLQAYLLDPPPPTPYPADATVKDMEAAAIAWTAELSGTPFMALKVVTDIVDGGRPTQDEFFENLATAAASLQEKVPQLIDFVVGKKLSDL